MNLDFRSEQALAGARQFQQAQMAQHPKSSDAQPTPDDIEPVEDRIAAAAASRYAA